MSDKPTVGVIAIDHGKLAIFGSRMGFLGPVIQHYAPFTNETEAIEAAKGKVAAMGLPLEEKISRPRITSMRVTYAKLRRPQARKERE